jgi:hypothetical protein
LCAHLLKLTPGWGCWSTLPGAAGLVRCESVVNR